MHKKPESFSLVNRSIGNFKTFIHFLLNILNFLLKIEKKSREEEQRKELKLKKLGQVEKYRKYRIGDFPDIQIKYSEIIAPIQALAQRDSQIAMMLFESLFA